MNYDFKLLQNNEHHHTLFKYVILTKYEFQISIKKKTNELLMKNINIVLGTF